MWRRKMKLKVKNRKMCKAGLTEGERHLARQKNKLAVGRLLDARPKRILQRIKRVSKQKKGRPASSPPSDLNSLFEPKTKTVRSSYRPRTPVRFGVPALAQRRAQERAGMNFMIS